EREAAPMPADPSSRRDDAVSAEDLLLAAVLALIARRAGPSPGAVRVKIDTDSGFLFKTALPAVTSSTPFTGDGSARVVRKSDRCRREITQTPTEVGHRLTMPQLLAALEARGFDWSERKVLAELSRMKAAGLADNDQEARPPGYGLRG